MINILSVNDKKLAEAIYSFGEREGNYPRYIVMNNTTLTIFNNQVNENFSFTPCTFLGIPIAISNHLKDGEIELI